MTESGSLTTLLFVVIALAVVLALAWLFLKGLMLLGQRGSAKNPMTIKATLPISSRERLMILEYKGHDYLLGVSSGSVSLIDKHTASPASNPDT